MIVATISRRIMNYEFFYHWSLIFIDRYLKIIQIETAIETILIPSQTLQTCPFRIGSLKVKGWGEGVRTLRYIYICICLFGWLYIMQKPLKTWCNSKKGYWKKKTKFSDDHINMRLYKTPTYLHCSTCLKIKQ